MPRRSDVPGYTLTVYVLRRMDPPLVGRACPAAKDWADYDHIIHQIGFGLRANARDNTLASCVILLECTLVMFPWWCSAMVVDVVVEIDA